MFNAASTGLGFLSKIGTTNSKHVDGIYEGFSNVDGIFFSLVDTSRSYLSVFICLWMYLIDVNRVAELK